MRTEKPDTTHGDNGSIFPLLEAQNVKNGNWTDTGPREAIKLAQKKEKAGGRISGRSNR